MLPRCTDGAHKQDSYTAIALSKSVSLGGRLQQPSQREVWEGYDHSTVLVLLYPNTIAKDISINYRLPNPHTTRSVIEELIRGGVLVFFNAIAYDISKKLR
ncbi:UNVERIFIED_CONTAM: hypothetical protein FKN15_077203 [Acipenser sinensis]